MGLPTFGCKASAGEGTDSTDSTDSTEVLSCIFMEECGGVVSREKEVYVRRRGISNTKSTTRY